MNLLQDIIFDHQSPKALEPADFFHISGNYIKE